MSNKESKHCRRVQQAIDDLECVGILRKNGEFRKGQPVYELTDFGKQFGDEHPDGEDFEAAVDTLLRRKRALH